MGIASKILIVVLAMGISASVTYKYTKQFVSQSYELQIKADAARAAAEVSELKTKKAAAEKRLREKTDEIDKQYKDRVDTLQSTIADLRRDNQRLRDPGYQTDIHSDTGDSTSPGEDGGATSTAGLLSKQTTDFLFDTTAQADEYLEQLRSCRDYSEQVRKAISDWEQMVKRRQAKSDK